MKVTETVDEEFIQKVSINAFSWVFTSRKILLFSAFSEIAVLAIQSLLTAMFDLISLNFAYAKGQMPAFNKRISIFMIP